MLTSPLFVEAVSHAETVGVRFRPGGAYPFFSCPLSTFTDRVVCLEDLWGDSAHRLWDALAAADSDAARAGIIARALLERLIRAGHDRVTAAAVGSLVRSNGRRRVAAIARQSGVTARHLQRRFHERVGVSPKVLARILRFQNTLRCRTSVACAADSRIDWVRVAVECGYADQSHLIHDYAAFAGETPACLVAAESELSAYFTAPQRLAALFGERRYE
jgi:AraC-like DNA-binding protein